MDYKKLYTKYKTLYFNQKNKIGGNKKKIKINIVDEHHHVLTHILKKNNRLNKNVKLLHFDSHPDMGLDLEYNNKKTIKKLFNNSFSVKKLVDGNEIGTWVLNLVANGMVNEVIWVAGYWCHQFRSGSYNFVLGIDKKSGLMKIATERNKKTSAIEYFNYDNLVTDEENLIFKRNWKLHVIKFDKDGDLNIKKMVKIKNIIKNNKWILDIDEDYLSTNNPHAVEFKSMFGSKNYNILSDIWNVEINNYYKYQKMLKKIIVDKIYRKHDFFKNNTIKNAIKFLNKNYSLKDSKNILIKFQLLCKNIFPKSKKDEWSTESLYDHNMILDTGIMVGVPHHISSLKLILKMINETFDLFNLINKDPEIITVATSRLDQYLPEDQADNINNLILSMLKESWSNSKIYRYDLKNHSTNEFIKLKK